MRGSSRDRSARLMPNVFLPATKSASMRRTDVRPMSRRRAISALLMPALCSFSIWLDCFPTVTGRPRCFPFSLASAMPARMRSRRISCSNCAKHRKQPGHRAASWRCPTRRSHQLLAEYVRSDLLRILCLGVKDHRDQSRSRCGRMRHQQYGCRNCRTRSPNSAYQSAHLTPLSWLLTQT